MKTPDGVLGRILVRTREHVLVRRREMPIDRILVTAPTPTGRRLFGPAISRPGQVNVIAEFKRRSPSRGVIREDLHPVSVAQAYEIAGAAALSVLTEEQFFGGSMEDLREARAATLLPTLSKDFVVDPYQIWDAWYAGADAVVLIVAALEDAELKHLLATAEEAGVEALVEVHDAAELQQALAAGARIVGVSNRDPTTMAVDPEIALSLAPLVPDDVVAVAQSGIRGPGDVRRLRDAGYDAVLVGEHLMSEADPGKALEAMIRESSALRWAGRADRAGTRVYVKICGITRVDDALAAAREGADAVGLVFSPGSPLRVDTGTARRISAALPPFVLRVGVFRDASREELARTVDDVGLDVLQLEGREPPETLEGLPGRVLKVVPVGPAFDPVHALRYEGFADGIVLDARGPASGPAPGGLGAFDWSRAREVREKVSFLMLAGGLTPDNVAKAVSAVRPDAVDVSSGVESAPGLKDPAKVRAFVHAVARATGRGPAGPRGRRLPRLAGDPDIGQD
jgi:indole-3-glycerol phosphate synthase/phosphoribosylanthranilate isomerase